MRKILLPLLSLGFLTFAVLHVVHAQQKGPDVQPPVEPARSPFARTVAGAGIVESRTENISIGSHLPGVVEKVFVKVGDPVKVGDKLFQLDARALTAELDSREAALKAAQAQLDRLKEQPRKEELPPSKARVEEAQANFADQQNLERRARDLYNRQAIGEEEYDRRKYALDAARAQLRRATAEYDLLKAGAWQWDKEVAAAAVVQARAQRDQTRTELDRLVVRASVDGSVLQVNVRSGEFVGAPPGQILMMLGDVSVKHVRVDIDENDIPRFRKGAPARAVLRGAPQRGYRLGFVRVEPYVIPKKSLTGDSTERVDTRVLQVIYALGQRGEKRVFVGQQLDVFLDDGGK